MTHTTVSLRSLFLILVLAIASCSSELNDANDLPGQPTLYGAHGRGYAQLASDNFHALDIRNRLGWDITGCRSCHGPDYEGGTTRLSCNSSGCHVAADGGPEACYLCHGDTQTKKIYPQWYNSHALHLEGGTLAAVTIQCTDCHDMPNNYEDPIHIDKTTPGKAEVHFRNSFAAIQTKGTVGTPSYDAVAGSCANTYCHGNFTNGNNATVFWKGQDQAKCGSCHGDPTTGSPLPGGTHPQVENCAACHSAVVDANRNIIDRSKHINGKLEVFGQERTDW
jgi:predicted CxxxxCH...CXXCH cytochrome family protein